MNKLNSQNYDFLWLVNNQSYLVTSILLTKEYKNKDFVMIGNHQGVRTYIGKKQRDILSKKGWIFFQKEFFTYKSRVEDKLKTAPEFLKKIRGMNYSSLNRDQLATVFSNSIRFFRLFWSLYFFTEYFFHDKVQEKLSSTANGKVSLLKKVELMQTLKLKLRAVINESIFNDKTLAKQLAEIKKRLKLKNIYFLSYEEIIKYLRGEKIIEPDRLNFVLGKFNNWQPLIKNDALAFLNSFKNLTQSKRNITEFKGSVAYPGIYRGKVKIIPFDLCQNITEKIAQMKQGQILVTGSTGPEMILACQKAGAIITEEGGVCSHAAIISRELKIPCVIGTKIATQVLKDGDLVEVDGNKGIVRKI